MSRSGSVVLDPVTPAPSPVARWLADDTRFWTAATLLFGAFAILKGLRAPGEWALTQAQFDYSHGFIKRGLFGAIYTALHLHHRRPLTIAFFAELALFFVLLALFTYRSGLAQRFGTPAVLTAFSSSYAVTYLTHLVGYTDILVAAITILLLSVRNPRPRLLLGLVVVPVAMLLHESFLLLLLPVVLFSFLLDSTSTSDSAKPTSPRHPLLFAATLAAVALLLAFVLALRANLPIATIDQFRSEMAARVDFPLRDDVFPVFHRSLRANVLEALTGIKHIEWMRNFAASTFAILPVLALALVWMRRLTRVLAHDTHSSSAPPPSPHAGLTARRRLLWPAALAASFSPLLMYLLGWDCARWNVTVLLATYLTLLLLSRHLPGVALPFTTADRNAIILLVAINMASGSGFFDRFETRPYPFFPGWMYTSHSVHPIPRS